MPQFPFVTLDVFTERRFGGNPLAVVTDAWGLDGAAMQAIAAEFGYSESTFILPPKDPANTAEVRIFTPTMEIGFAGHPNVGTAQVVAERIQAETGALPDRLRFEEGAGLVIVEILKAGDGTLAGTRITAPQPLMLGGEVDVETVAACIGLGAEAIRTDRHAPVFASVGLKFVIAELGSLKDLAAALPDMAASRRAQALHAEETDHFPIFLYVREESAPDAPMAIRARMFAPLDKIPEDPATGSASGALGALLATLDPRADAWIEVRIRQGVEMGRESIIDVAAEKRQRVVERVTIAGRSLRVMEGFITV
ncbi:PhzF family phenazine biosynthesis protein [Rhizobium rhizosphaerae]|uniref:PhzF family phenazine biosynthesis protein n=1 Tax=Xaviernesmea rhizosphaerae TaxID=1672749 RepID=A0A1Q9ACQ2_9HYPH|nr:PhzF family phenazine biosynthesis protein [Xaviernesmea rhizosphaerae]OLP52664.1 PhzF family phenazine biosynthesis protein [Xaviernesmea rhizosphaerae]